VLRNFLKEEHDMNSTDSLGFTLIELLITLCVLSVAASIGVPSFIHLIESNQQQTLRNTLLVQLQTARGQAVFRGRNIELCGSGQPNDCDNAWASGLMIRDADTGEVLLFQPLKTTGSLRWKGSINHQSVVYNSNGTTPASNGRFIYCSKDSIALWQIVINRQGRFRQAEGLESGQNHSALCG
jgi:type IV fimbrial biogenesis protein FimT